MRRSSPDSLLALCGKVAGMINVTRPRQHWFGHSGRISVQLGPAGEGPKTACLAWEAGHLKPLTCNATRIILLSALYATVYCRRVQKFQL